VSYPFNEFGHECSHRSSTTASHETRFTVLYHHFCVDIYLPYHLSTFITHSIRKFLKLVYSENSVLKIVACTRKVTNFSCHLSSWPKE